ncbi:MULTISPECIES: hypothetical protein [Pseudomonas]|uniref:Uncharacterized protein n=1 Tax=Pseudomonas wuhanensis TaxID=2954098 RepID=A0ABY9H1D7_9PSED|nr:MULTISPECIES: hypothetical protein [unclassified Pseudomonas]WLI15409.1 hypothetical protein PSH65_15400 [Pseudomonas sp. FP603]WLI21085.1 hypothetical protein PSH88_14030 [Pseudomonas sp. FP607]
MNEWTNEMSDKAIYAVMERCGMLQNESGWFILSIHDAEDGPVCIWGRRVTP